MNRRSIPITLALCAILAGCATTSIENRGIPKCSGHERRPLNNDMWNWQAGEPVLRPRGEANGGETQPVAPAIKSYLPASRSDEPFTHVLGPRWDIEASYAECKEKE